MKLKLPKIFCWSRMGAESGQRLDIILARKELERKAGNGLFIWGVGNSLGNKVWEFVKTVKNPKILFSKIKSNAKSIDYAPESVYSWTSYIDRNGDCYTIPEHALVLSRASTKNSFKKKGIAPI